MKKYLNILIVFVVLITSCTKTTQDLDSSIDVPIVEAFLSPGNEALVRLTRPIPYSDDTTLQIIKEISGISVYITSDSINYMLSEIEDSAGYYKDMSGDLIIENNKNYNLEFIYNDKQIQSHTLIPLKLDNFDISQTILEIERITDESGWGPPNMTEIELSWDDENNDTYLIFIQYLEDEYDTINQNIEIEDASQFANFSSQPMTDNFYTIRSMQFMFFGEYRIVLSRISDEYAQLYESLNQSSLDGLTEPPSNIINGKGIFTSFSSDTLYLNVVED